MAGVNLARPNQFQNNKNASQTKRKNIPPQNGRAAKSVHKDEHKFQILRIKTTLVALFVDFFLSYLPPTMKLHLASTVLPESLVDPKTGFIHGTLYRPSDGWIKKADLTFMVGDETVLVARKTLTGYQLTDATTNQSMGSVARTSSHSLTDIAYVFKNEAGVPIMGILYLGPDTILRNLPPRRAQVVMLPSTFQSTTAMDAALKATRSLTTIPDATVWTTKAPYLKPNGKMGLNFNGRGKMASNKNMQLETNDATKTVTLQMAQWDDHTFCLDIFPNTLSIVAAFAFGVAQLDL